MAGRTRGSCRFEPYYNIDAWDPASGCWKAGKRKPYATAGEARKAARLGRFRLVFVTEKGRTVGAPEEK